MVVLGNFSWFGLGIDDDDENDDDDDDDDNDDDGDDVHDIINKPCTRRLYELEIPCDTTNTPEVKIAKPISCKHLQIQK